MFNRPAESEVVKRLAGRKQTRLGRQLGLGKAGGRPNSIHKRSKRRKSQEGNNFESESAVSGLVGREGLVVWIVVVWAEGRGSFSGMSLCASPRQPTHQSQRGRGTRAKDSRMGLVHRLPHLIFYFLLPSIELLTTDYLTDYGAITARQGLQK